MSRERLSLARRHRRKLMFIAIVLLLPLLAHVAVIVSARPTSPRVELPSYHLEHPTEGLTRFGPSWLLVRGALLEVGLSGSPESIGYSHSRLLYPYMVENEGILLGYFGKQVPSRVLQQLLLDLAQLRYREVDAGMSSPRLREIAAGAYGFQPDPYSGFFPTYQRFVYLNALYDIALSFETSPLIGCTSFAFSGARTEDGGALLARAFDFEVNDIFDRRKAVFLIREEGKIPFASVAWPGLVGVVSGMNAEGLAVVVHGGRAGEPRTRGEPVVHALRRVLSEARTVSEAIAKLGEQPPLVSHLVVLADASGNTAVVERVPGAEPFVRKLPSAAVVTNHLEGPFALDPKNQRVRERTSTLPRRHRGDEMLSALSGPIDAERAVALLRDRAAEGGGPLPLGDRRAIDALIATHGVVMETKSRVLWVSESPHLLGRFVAFDLKRMLSPDYRPEERLEQSSLAADPLATSNEYKVWKESAVDRGPPGMRH
ncbi:MAG TPA: C45 family peptidase [Polyangiaceae bacterium]|nr:C45 family peptidase [Polyangiaceae bacterium]